MLTVLSVLALIVAIYGSILFLIVAFKESVLWGVACLLPIFPVVFLLVHWEESKRPFFVSLLGWIFYLGTKFGFLAGS